MKQIVQVDERRFTKELYNDAESFERFKNGFGKSSIILFDKRRKPHKYIINPQSIVVYQTREDILQGFYRIRREIVKNEDSSLTDKAPKLASGNP